MSNLTRRVFVPVTLCGVSALIVLSGSSAPVAATAAPATVAAQDNPVEATDESITAGRRVYNRFCRSCHGMRADGRGMAAPAGSRPANLIDAEWVHGDTDAAIYKVIREGVPPAYDMDAWEGRVTDEEIWHVINYLRDLAGG